MSSSSVVDLIALQEDDEKYSPSTVGNIIFPKSCFSTKVIIEYPTDIRLHGMIVGPKLPISQQPEVVIVNLVNRSDLNGRIGVVTTNATTDEADRALLAKGRIKVLLYHANRYRQLTDDTISVKLENVRRFHTNNHHDEKFVRETAKLAAKSLDQVTNKKQEEEQTRQREEERARLRAFSRSTSKGSRYNHPFLTAEIMKPLEEALRRSLDLPDDFDDDQEDEDFERDDTTIIKYHIPDPLDHLTKAMMEFALDAVKHGEKLVYAQTILLSDETVPQHEKRRRLVHDRHDLATKALIDYVNDMFDCLADHCPHTTTINTSSSGKSLHCGHHHVHRNTDFPCNQLTMNFPHLMSFGLHCVYCLLHIIFDTGSHLIGMSNLPLYHKDMLTINNCDITTLSSSQYQKALAAMFDRHSLTALVGLKKCLKGHICLTEDVRLLARQQPLGRSMFAYAKDGVCDLPGFAPHHTSYAPGTYVPIADPGPGNR